MSDTRGDAAQAADLPQVGAFDELMAVRGLPPVAAGEVGVAGSDPFYRIPYRVGETTAALLAAVGVASNDIWELRTGRRQQVRVDVRHAAATTRTVDYTRALGDDGQYRHVPLPADMSYMLTVTQPWQARNGWVLPHFNLPHLARRVLDVLQCDYTPAAVAAAVANWDADELEAAIAAANACGGKIRTPQEWLAHPQGAYLAARPVIEITRIADGPPEPFPEGLGDGLRPLSGVRVLDLTRILAGPIAGRTLAEHGADVLLVTAEKLPQTPEHVRDTSHGKRSCYLDFTRPGDHARLLALAGEADVMISGYRPGRLAAHGFGMEELMRRRPGLVYLSISCFGSGGPFAGRSGWEQVAQAVTGVCHTYGQLANGGRPKLVFAPVCDYTTGYLGALGTMLALARRAREGGSYHVQVSLCQSAMLIQRQGLLHDFGQAPEKLTEAELARLYVEADTGYGRLRTLGPALQMSETPCRWARPTPAPGSDRPEWLPR
ncbi:CoA transferase [Pigmentiphaga soli]|uniref:CoA transferase n=1 Tax=Pigmentiphaga soli TaxID=1007095 RepID=A0ABP8H607_9BURK